MSAKLKGIRPAVGEALADVDALRDRIAGLQEERRHVEGLPADRAEAERRIDALIEGRRAKEPLRPYGLFAADRNVFDVNKFAAGLAADPLAVLATMFPAELRDALAEQIPDVGIDEAERAARLAKIDGDLEAAAIAEEVALREIEEATGTEALRRGDADPAILVAPDSEIGR